MSGDTITARNRSALADQALKRTAVSVIRCYQCGKCSAGCPLAADMDYPPSLIMRMLQTGAADLEEKVLRSYTIWLCLSCETCFARCPMEIDIPKLMDFLRGESLRWKLVSPKAKEILAFHRSFLDTLRATGRLYEVGLIADYKLRSWHFFQDLLLAPWMLAKGKLHLFPERIRNRRQMRQIFRRSRTTRQEGP